MSRRLMLRNASGGGGILPSGYRQVNCITIPEGGFISTGLPPTLTSEITITARINSSLNVNRSIWYSRGGGGGDVQFQYVNAFGTDTGFTYQFGTTYIQHVGTKDNSKHTFYTKGTKFVVDENITAYLPSQPNQPSGRPILLAARQNRAGTGYEQFSNLTVWSYQHNSDTQRSQTLVPCQRLSDSAFGMYDIEADLFIGNSGTGIITEGVE